MDVDEEPRKVRKNSEETRQAVEEEDDNVKLQGAEEPNLLKSCENNQQMLSNKESVLVTKDNEGNSKNLENISATSEDHVIPVVADDENISKNIINSEIENSEKRTEVTENPGGSSLIENHEADFSNAPDVLVMELENPGSVSTIADSIANNSNQADPNMTEETVLSLGHLNNITEECSNNCESSTKTLLDINESVKAGSNSKEINSNEGNSDMIKGLICEPLLEPSATLNQKDSTESESEDSSETDNEEGSTSNNLHTLQAEVAIHKPLQNTSLGVIASQYSSSESEDDDSSSESVQLVNVEVPIHNHRESKVIISSEDSDSDIEIISQSSAPPRVIEVDDDDDENSGKPRGPIRAKGELTLDDLPPIEDLHITVPEEECVELGKVHSIVEQLVLVDSIPGTAALDLDTVLFLEKGNKVLGEVFDVIGQVSSPLYCVRFNSNKQIKERGIEVGQTVYVAPRTEHTHFIILSNLTSIRGSDASWEDDVEPPEKHLDYSDDEEERNARRAHRARKQSDEGDPAKKQKQISAPQHQQTTHQKPRYQGRKQSNNQGANFNTNRNFQASPFQYNAATTTWHANFTSQSPSPSTPPQPQMLCPNPFARPQFSEQQSPRPGFSQFGYNSPQSNSFNFSSPNQQNAQTFSQTQYNPQQQHHFSSNQFPQNSPYHSYNQPNFAFTSSNQQNSPYIPHNQQQFGHPPVPFNYPNYNDSSLGANPNRSQFPLNYNNQALFPPYPQPPPPPPPRN